MNTMIRVLSFGLLLCVPGLALAAQPRDKYYKEIVGAEGQYQEVRPSQAAREQAAREQAQEAHAELKRREQFETGISLFKGE